MFNIKRLFELAAIAKMKLASFLQGSTGSKRSDKKKGKSEQQLHAMRYPARQFHPQICKEHRKFWEKRGYTVN